MDGLQLAWMIEIISYHLFGGEIGLFGLTVIALAAIFALAVGFAFQVTAWRCIYNKPSQWLGRPTRDQWLGKPTRRNDEQE
jgi:hypothetical protein